MGNKTSSNKKDKPGKTKKNKRKKRNKSSSNAEEKKTEANNINNNIKPADNNNTNKPPQNPAPINTKTSPKTSPKRSPRPSPRASPRGSPLNGPLSGSAPPSIESFLAKQNKKKRKLPDLPKFGAPLDQQMKRQLNEDTDYKQDSIRIHDDYGPIPSILILLKKYLLKFNAYQYVGIFANGSIQNIDKYHKPSKPKENAKNNDEEMVFIEGFVSKVDVFGIKQLIETNKIEQHDFGDYGKGEEKHYAMIFAELVKLWIQYLSIGLLNNLPSTFFDDITSSELLELEIDKVPEPNLSAFLFIIDICVEVSNNHTVNQMTIKRIGGIIGPYLYKDKNKERNEQLKPVLARFTEIAIEWRRAKE